MAATMYHEVFGTPLEPVPADAEVAYFGLGCFWGAEKLFWSVPGVVSTAVGYQGGSVPAPTYERVCSGRTGHAEVVRVAFDPTRVSYEHLVKLFFENHDPTQGNRQGNDIGTQYRSVLFPTDPAQREAAEAIRQRYQPELAAQGYGPITTDIAAGETPEFHLAEAYHQQYLDKNPRGYCPIHATGVACR